MEHNAALTSSKRRQARGCVVAGRRGPFYLQTMVFGRNMMPIEEISEPRAG